MRLMVDILAQDCDDFVGADLFVYNVAFQVKQHSGIDWTPELIVKFISKLEQDLDREEK